MMSCVSQACPAASVVIVLMLKEREWATLLIKGGYLDSAFVSLIGVHQLLEGTTGLMFSNIPAKISVLYFRHLWSRSLR